MKGKVTGIGGIFFVAENPGKLTEWYKSILGITGVFHWKEIEKEQSAFSSWKVFGSSDEMFKGSSRQYCYSYRVDDLDTILDNLSSSGVGQTKPIAEDVSGKYGFITDPEGNPIILWQGSGVMPDVVPSPLQRITGIGGIFFKANDTAKINEWYGAHLGFEITKWGCSFEWIDPNDPKAKSHAQTAWSTFKADTEYFLPSQKPFMINYRVADLSGLIEAMRSENVTIIGEIEDTPYGKFARIMDPDGNKLELWEPKDDGF